MTRIKADLPDSLTAPDNALAKPGIRRGTQAHRSASMRRRLVDAAIACLCEVGYAATTIQMVTEEAGVSRGAMLHHFPTKLDLIIAVGEFAAAAQNRHVRAHLSQVPEGPQRFLALTEATWEAICEPPALALIEIMVASRSDPILHERFPPVIQALENQQLEDVLQMAKELGINDDVTVSGMVRLHRAAMRGLVIERAFVGQGEGIAGGMELLRRHKRTLTAQLLVEAMH